LIRAIEIAGLEQEKKILADQVKAADQSGNKTFTIPAKA